MSVVHSRGNACRAMVLVAVAFLGFLFISESALALLYRAPEGTMKDNCVVWEAGTYYLFTMYRFEEKGGEQDQWRNVWLATSTDGVHWKDVGPVIRDAPFGIYAMRVWRVGNRFLMNHGSFTGDKQDVLRLWESPDLVHWTLMGPEYDIRRPDGQRIDHMDVIAEQEEGRTVYYGYAVGGILRSEDGAKWKWLGELPLADNLSIRVVQEPGGCQRIGDKYYLLVGGFYPGSFEYAVGTFISEKPVGPFRPDYPALRLNGYSGRDLVALWACYCRLPQETLLSNYILDPGGRFWWHAPLKTAVVDGGGHLRMGYWKGNEALKGAALPCDVGRIRVAVPGFKGDVAVSENQVTLKAPALPPIRWLTPDKPNFAVAYLDPVFDFDKGCVVEGTMKVTGTDALIFPAVGLCLESKHHEATAILFGTWGQTQIGPFRGKGQPQFEARDVTGFGCATVAGISSGETRAFRLLIRKGIFEIYLDDLLVQTYSAKDLTGRVGFIVQDGQGTFDRPKAWEMSLR